MKTMLECSMCHSDIVEVSDNDYDDMVTSFVSNSIFCPRCATRMKTLIGDFIDAYELPGDHCELEQAYKSALRFLYTGDL